MYLMFMNCSRGFLELCVIKRCNINVRNLEVKDDPYNIIIIIYKQADGKF